MPFCLYACHTHLRVTPSAHNMPPPRKCTWVKALQIPSYTALCRSKHSALYAWHPWPKHVVLHPTHSFASWFHTSNLPILVPLTPTCSLWLVCSWFVVVSCLLSFPLDNFDKMYAPVFSSWGMCVTFIVLNCCVKFVALWKYWSSWSSLIWKSPFI